MRGDASTLLGMTGQRIVHKYCARSTGVFPRKTCASRAFATVTILSVN